MNNLSIENIQEEFLKACHGSKQSIKNILNHPLASIINYTENDYEIIKLIEEKHPDLLELILLQRIKLEGRIQKDNCYINANTYYCLLSLESQKNTKLALSMLINANEYLDLIPDEVKTPEFLQKLSKKYKQDIFDFEFIYNKEYENFLLSYIKSGHKLSKKITFTEELLKNRNFIISISKYPCNIFPLIAHIYSSDLELMSNIAMSDKEAFPKMSSQMRNKISSNENNALKVIDINPLNYQYLNKNMQLNKNCIEKTLSLKPAMYENFLPEIKNNEILNLDLLKKYNIDVLFLSDIVKNNKEIAFVMTKRNGSSLSHFPKYKEDPELINLALLTSKKLSLIPESQRNTEKIKSIVLQANKEENSFNLHYLNQEVKENREFILELIEKDLFFKEDIFVLVNDYGNHKQDYEIVKACIKKHTDLYGRFFNFKDDYEIIHIYIESMKKETNGKFSLNLIPQKIKAEASMQKAPVDKYIFNKVLEKQAENWSKNENVKVKRMKI